MTTPPQKRIDSQRIPSRRLLESSLFLDESSIPQKEEQLIGAIPNHTPPSLGIGMNYDLDRSSDPLRKGSERFFDLPERKRVSRKRL